LSSPTAEKASCFTNEFQEHGFVTNSSWSRQPYCASPVERALTTVQMPVQPSVPRPHSACDRSMNVPARWLDGRVVEGIKVRERAHEVPVLITPVVIQPWDLGNLIRRASAKPRRRRRCKVGLKSEQGGLIVAQLNTSQWSMPKEIRQHRCLPELMQQADSPRPEVGGAMRFAYCALRACAPRPRSPAYLPIWPFSMP